MLVEDAQELVTAERRCPFQVELALPTEADELCVLDASGEALIISEFRGSSRRENDRHPIVEGVEGVEGRSSTLAVGDRATTLVLYRGGAEVRRVSLHLETGTPARVRP